jgi:transcriptional regulator with XRE-family HTH domain
MTQKQLAKIAGVSERELRRIETGDVTLKGPVLFRIGRALHVGVDDLVESNAQENRAKRVLEEHLSASHPERMQERIAMPTGATDDERVPIFDRPEPVTTRVVLPPPGPIRQVVRPLAVATPQ